MTDHRKRGANRLAVSRCLDKRGVALLASTLVKVSQRTVAREWLIFLPLFVLGGIFGA
jgi:hypothetical protein